MWTITHVRDGERVRTFYYDPCKWATRAEAQRYLDALIQRGDLAARIFPGEDALMASMRVDEIGKF